MGTFRQRYRLNRTPKHAWAMLRTMMDQLVMQEKITTTDAKAKALWPIANKMLNRAKRNNHGAYDLVNSTLRTKQAKLKVFKKLNLRYQ